MKVVTGFVPNLTFTAFDRYFPFTETSIPIEPLSGVIDVISGTLGNTLKSSCPEDFPAAETLTFRSPGVTPSGTAVTTCVVVLDAGVVLTEPKFILSTAERFCPVIVTLLPIVPEVGLRAVISGFGSSGSSQVTRPNAIAIK